MGAPRYSFFSVCIILSLLTVNRLSGYNWGSHDGLVQNAPWKISRHAVLAPRPCRTPRCHRCRPRRRFSGLPSTAKRTSNKYRCVTSIHSPPSPSSSSKISNTGLVGDASTNEITAEPKKEKEKAEFEARLKGAEIAHAQEQAFLSHTPPNYPASDSVPAADSQSTDQTTPPATADSKGKSSWKRWFGGSGDSNKS